jgi:hypothetical protein
MTLTPVLDLIKRRSVIATSLRVLVRNELLNLTSPVDNDGFKALDLVLLLSSSFDIV